MLPLQATLLMALLFCFGAGAFFSGAVTAADRPPMAREPEVKAAYLFNFGIFTEWSEEKLPRGEAPFIIGVLGNSAVATELEKFAQQKQIARRKVLVRRLRPNADLSECHILFVGSDVDSDAVLANLKAAGSKAEGILTVGETDKFVDRGGMINFVFVRDNLKYEINPSVVERAGLKVSAQVLRLAINVDSPAEGRGGRG